MGAEAEAGGSLQSSEAIVTDPPSSKSILTQKVFAEMETEDMHMYPLLKQSLDDGFLHFCIFIHC